MWSCCWLCEIMFSVESVRFSVLMCFVCFRGCCYSSAPNEGFMRFRCRGGKSYTLFCILLWNFFNFSIVFLLSFMGLFCRCDQFLIFDSLVASSYIGQIYMMEHLSAMWSPVSYNCPILHVRFCAYHVHLIIYFWCYLLKFGFGSILLG